ncbi:MAG: GTP-binding protein, partial [Promethearchaeota archaeon]
MSNNDNLIPVHVGLLGHIDSGKTAIAKSLTEIASTAGLDKHPQAQRRGITIDMGFTFFSLENYM